MSHKPYTAEELKDILGPNEHHLRPDVHSSRMLATLVKLMADDQHARELAADAHERVSAQNAHSTKVGLQQAADILELKGRVSAIEAELAAAAVVKESQG